MKIVFFLPFYDKPQHDVLSWIPISVPNLIGNIKTEFPDIDFSIIELKKSITEIILNEENHELIEYLFSIGNNYPKEKDLEKFEKYFSRIDKHLNLSRYDHYFFSHFSANYLGIVANLLFARYLKRKYKSKKIIFGGVYGFGKNYAKCSFEEVEYIDSSVIGYGENSTIEILRNILNGKKLKKVYTNYTPPEKVLEFLPDYKCIKDFEKSRCSIKKIEEIYNIKLKNNKQNNSILFIPYKFNIGCHWKKCSYCRQSYCVNFTKKPILYSKDCDTIISDLLKLKKIYKTKYFIFLSNNFNSNLDFSKKLLEGIIKKKLDILWTDSFNLNIFDDEMLDLLVGAGCFRMDLGVTTLNPVLQKLYSNSLQDNKKLENLEKISKRGIWSHINLIVNLPYQYDLKKEINVLMKYINYIDGVAINNYRRTPDTGISINYKKYKIKKIFEEFIMFNKRFYLYYLENEFSDSLEKRKKMFASNQILMRKFFKNNGLSNTIDKVHIYLLGYLYDVFGFHKKSKIKEIIMGVAPNLKNEK